MSVRLVLLRTMSEAEIPRSSGSQVGRARPAYQSFVCALEHVADEMEASAPGALSADEPEVVHVSDALLEAGGEEGTLS